MFYLLLMGCFVTILSTNHKDIGALYVFFADPFLRCWDTIVSFSNELRELTGFLIGTDFNGNQTLTLIIGYVMVMVIFVVIVACIIWVRITLCNKSVMSGNPKETEAQWKIRVAKECWNWCINWCIKAVAFFFLG